jgi:hypothetical protein
MESLHMNPTKEQEEAIRLFKTGDSLAIEAGAGTGKTSTLVMLADAAGGTMRGQYVAFNKALVEESKAKFPRQVACNTAHSLAFRAVGKNYASRLNNSQRTPSYVIAQRLRLQALSVEDFQGVQKVLQDGLLAGLVVKTVQRFCQTAAPEINQYHVPVPDGLSLGGQQAVRELITPHAQAMWDDLQLESGWAPFKHEHYLKMWQLDNPVIGADYILFDEAQDANPVIASIIANQEEYSQIVYVGDSQQEIYAWTGAVNALSKVEVAHRSFLTQSFRFGPAIADRANTVLDTLQAPLRLTGNPAIDSRLEVLERPKAILVRTNASGLAYLLQMQKDGVRAHFIGGTDQLLGFVRGAQQLMQTGRSIHPDLVCFNSWGEVQSYVQQDASGEELRLNVRLVDGYGVEVIEKALNTMPYEGAAEVIISTAHRSKGREWSSVQLSGDFPQTADSTPADLRLLYVAITRAKESLDVTAVDERQDRFKNESALLAQLVGEPPEGGLVN